MSDHFPPDDDLGPEMTPLEAFSRAMRIKLRLNREARARRAAASQASEKSAQPSEPSATDDVNSEEVEDRLSEKRFRERFDRTQPSEPSAPLVEPISAEEPDQAILDRLPGLTKEDLERIAEIP